MATGCRLLSAFFGAFVFVVSVWFGGLALLFCLLFVFGADLSGLVFMWAG